MRNHKTKIYRKIAALLLCIGLPTSLLFSNNTGSIFDHLATASDDIETSRSVILRMPFDSIYAKSPNEQMAIISFTDDTGREFRRSLRVGVRGKFRRHLCTFPPIRLNFSKKRLEEDGMSRHDKLKLVTPCFEGDRGQELVLREYLAYKLYAQLSPYAFRVQLLEITYRDLLRKHPDQTVFAFVLEDTDEMAERLGGVELENGRGIAPEQFDRRAETTQALFEYMIGNLDWNLAMSRNLKMVELPNGTVLPVPYDFDFSALVHAPYARLNTAVGQDHAGQRIYLGLSCPDELLNEAFANFDAKRKDLLKTIRGFSLLHLDKRYEITHYLGEFYYDFRRLQRQRSITASVDDLQMYRLVRGEQATLIPPGAKASYYEVSR